MRYQTLPIKPETKDIIDELYLDMRKKREVKSYNSFILMMFNIFNKYQKIKNKKKEDEKNAKSGEDNCQG